MSNQKTLDNLTYIIVGGTSGMGLSSAIALHNEGANIIAIGLDDDSCAETRETLKDKGIVIQGNATNPETINKAISEAVNTYGIIHGMFHVAGGSGRKFGDGPLHEMTVDAWNKTLELNLTSIMISNQAMISYYLKNECPGSILNMGSVLGYSPSPKYFTTHAYATSKAAIIGMSKSIASFYAKNNIRINVIAPGLYSTPMAERAMTNDVIMDFIKTKQPLDGGRPGFPEDINPAVIMLLSPETKFITGQVIAVDGGWTVSEGQF